MGGEIAVSSMPGQGAKFTGSIPVFIAQTESKPLR
jgi:signal transduction histidine kinase